ncbi:hypothetical protein BD626DRAFT_127927 [Schizophyllum amplum]|uniref:Uncharacterized protein n=1 Tax=Schizophyllum amplum TaxID=97359 RepID=A0A550C778_9AGAR|nr:hypothetical protein BD626DRAFT_127927 [Auriculariopsis ampla]
MDVDDYNDDIIIVDSPPMPRMRTETAATSKPRPPINTTHSDPQLVTRAIPSKVRLDDSDKLPPTSSTLATSPSGGSTVRTAEQHTREAGRLPGPGQVNPFAARLAGGVTTSKRTTSRKGSKAAVPLLPAPPNPAFTEHPTLEPARPPLYTKGSTSIATSSASSFRRTATSQRERTVTPQLSDGTVTDLGDKLEEMNVDAPEPVADPDLPPSTHRQPSADTSVPYTRVSPAALPRPLLSPLDEAIQRLHSAKAPLSSSRPTIVKGPIPGESLAFEWLTLRPHGPAEGRLDKESKTIRRPRKAAAKFRGGRSLDRELLNISMHSAKI